MKTLLLLLNIFSLCKTTQASYTMEITIDRIHNPDNKLIDGKNCDYQLQGRACDYNFRICLDSTDGNRDHHSQCRVKGHFSLPLNQTQRIRVEQTWKGMVLMKIRVTDKDTLNKDDLVDKVSSIIQLNAFRNRREAHAQSVTLNGTHTSLVVQIGVYCNLNWIGPNCSCNGTHPHYTCYNNGTKICEHKWYGPECDVYCWPERGVSQHYNCSSNGTKECHRYYYGKDCTMYCKPQNDNKAGYKCENGSKICLKNWCSDHCNVSCPESSTLSTTIVTIDGTSYGKSEPKSKTGEGTNGNVDDQTGKQNVIRIIGGVVGVLLLLVAIGLGVFCYKRKQKKGGNGRNETISMQGLANSRENNTGGVIYDEINHDENLYEDAVAVAEQLYEDPNEANAADTYAVPDKKRGRSREVDRNNVSDSVLIMENECYGSASEAGQTRPQNVRAAANASDDVLIMDNELYGTASEVQDTEPKKATAVRDSSDDVLIVDNELYG